MRNVQVKRSEFKGMNGLCFEQRVENKWYQVWNMTKMMILVTLSQLFNFKALTWMHFRRAFVGSGLSLAYLATLKYMKSYFYPYRVMRFFHLRRLHFTVKKSCWLVFPLLFSLLSLVFAVVSLPHHVFPERQILYYKSFYLTAMLHFSSHLFNQVSFFSSSCVLYQSTLISSPSPFFFLFL